MAVELKKYDPQVKVSGAAAGVEGSLQTAGAGYMALAKAAESIGSSIADVYEQKGKLEAQAKKVKKFKELEDGSLLVQKDVNDALLGQGAYADTVNEDGTVKSNRVKFEDIEEQVLKPSIKKHITDKVTLDDVPGIIRNDVASMIQKTQLEFEKNVAIEAIQRETEQAKFTLTENIGDLSSKIELYKSSRQGDDTSLYGTDKDPRLNPDGTKPKELLEYEANVAQLKEDMDVLRNIGKPGEAETALSVALYNSGIEEITLLKEKLRTAEISTEEFDAQAEALQEKIISHPNMLNKHSSAVNAQINFALMEARGQMTRENNKIMEDILKKIFSDDATSEEISQALFRLPPVYEGYVRKAAGARLGTIAVTAETDSAFIEAWNALTAFSKGQDYDGDFVTVDRLGTLMSGVANESARELLMWYGGELFKERAATDPRGAWKAMGLDVPQNQQLSGKASSFLNNLGGYIQLFNVPGSTQTREEENKFISNNAKLFETFIKTFDEETQTGMYNGKMISYQEFEDKRFAENALIAMEILADNKVSYEQMTNATAIFDVAANAGAITRAGIDEARVDIDLDNISNNVIDEAIGQVGSDFMKYTPDEEARIQAVLEINPGISRQDAIEFLENNNWGRK